MRDAPVRLLATATLLLLTACSKGDRAAPSPPQPVKAAPVLGTTSGSAGAAQRPPGKARRGFDELKKELARKCPLKEGDGTEAGNTEAVASTTNCLRRKMIRDLDTVLLPLRNSAPERFHALMKEQAEWNRFVKAACNLEEERYWLDSETGERGDGSMRGLPYLSCLETAYTERILYARGRAAGSPDGIVSRVAALEARGAALQKIVPLMRQQCERWQRQKPPAPEDGVLADFADIVKQCAAVEAAIANVARSTCEGWPELAQALGGPVACGERIARYYYGQAVTEDPQW